MEEGPKEAERVGQATRAPSTLAAREGTMFCSLSRVCRANRIKPLLQYSQGGDDQGHRSVTGNFSPEKSHKERCSQERGAVREGLSEEVTFE